MLKVSTELYENALYYADCPLVKSQHENGVFISLKNAFVMCLSGATLSVFERSGNKAAVGKKQSRMHKVMSFRQ